MPFSWDKHQACVTEQEGGYLAALPALVGDGKRVVWWNLDGHQRSYMVAELLSDTDDYFAFEDERGRHHSLRPLTVQQYERLRPKLNPSNPTFKSDAELRAAVLRVVQGR
jgi:hypothetical protein